MQWTMIKVGLPVSPCSHIRPFHQCQPILPFLETEPHSFQGFQYCGCAHSNALFTKCVVHFGHCDLNFFLNRQRHLQYYWCMCRYKVMFKYAICHVGPYDAYHL